MNTKLVEMLENELKSWAFKLTGIEDYPVKDEVKILLQAFREVVPEAQERPDDMVQRSQDGWNACREELLKQLEG